MNSASRTRLDAAQAARFARWALDCVTRRRNRRRLLRYALAGHVRRIFRLARIVAVRFFVAIVAAHLVMAGCSRSKDNGPVDVTLTRSIDVTGDGEDDTVTLHVTGGAPTAPFTWTLSIHADGDADGKTIYHTERNDAEIDAIFNDAGSMEGCSGYAACKQRYYYTQILEGLIPTDLDVTAILDRSSPNGLYGVGRAFLKQCCARAGLAADKILKDIEAGLRDGSAIVIAIPTSPVAAGPPMVFAPDAGLFVPIFQP